MSGQNKDFGVDVGRQFFECKCWRSDPGGSSEKVDQLADRLLAAMGQDLIPILTCPRMFAMVMVRILARTMKMVPRNQREKVQDQILNLLNAEFDKVPTK